MTVNSLHSCRSLAVSALALALCCCCAEVTSAVLGAGRREVQCSLVLQGWGLTAPGVKFVSMTCSSTGIADGSVMQFGYNATQLRRFTSLAPGGVNNSSIQFRLVDNIPCQRAAEQGGFAALLFFASLMCTSHCCSPRLLMCFWTPGIARQLCWQLLVAHV